MLSLVLVAVAIGPGGSLLFRHANAMEAAALAKEREAELSASLRGEEQEGSAAAASSTEDLRHVEAISGGGGEAERAIDPEAITGMPRLSQQENRYLQTELQSYIATYTSDLALAKAATTSKAFGEEAKLLLTPSPETLTPPGTPPGARRPETSPQRTLPVDIPPEDIPSANAGFNHDSYRSPFLPPAFVDGEGFPPAKRETVRGERDGQPQE